MTSASPESRALERAAAGLRDATAGLSFPAPVAFTYHPLSYAWAPHREFIVRYGASRKKVIFVGMNPGPFGMAQTGVPFGEVAAVRDWMGIRGEVGPPAVQHPKRPVEGFECARSEVSGRRLWGLFQARYGGADAFFRDHFVVNYCPLLFLSETGANLTPDKFAGESTRAMFAACDEHLRCVVAALKPVWVIGVGGFAEGRAREALEGTGGSGWAGKFGRVLHPSPASPAANRGWAEAATRELVAQGVWPA